MTPKLTNILPPNTEPSGVSWVLNEITSQYTTAVLEKVNELLLERIQKYLPYINKDNFYMLKGRLTQVKQSGEPDRYYLDYATPRQVLLLEWHQGEISYKEGKVTYHAHFK